MASFSSTCFGFLPQSTSGKLYLSKVVKYLCVPQTMHIFHILYFILGFWTHACDMCHFTHILQCMKRKLCKFTQKPPSAISFQRQTLRFCYSLLSFDINVYMMNLQAVKNKNVLLRLCWVMCGLYAVHCRGLNNVSDVRINCRLLLSRLCPHHLFVRTAQVRCELPSLSSRLFNYQQPTGHTPQFTA